MKLLFAACALALAIAAQAAHAADTAWRITPYLWAAGFDGTVGVPGAEAGEGGRLDVDFDHLWDNLRLGGAMLNVDARRGRWSAFGDWTYARVSSDSETRVPLLYESVEAEISGHIVQASAGYDLLERADSHLDVFAGARWFSLDGELDLAGGALPPAHPEGSDSWLDAVAGVRWSTRFGGRWNGYVQADAGTGGSDLSWQLLAGIGYEYGWGTLVGGWRYLAADYSDDAYRLDAALGGLFLGVSFGP